MSNCFLEGISQDFKKKCAIAIKDAVGDDIKADIKTNRFVTHNGDSSRIWDYINRNLSEACNIDESIASPTKRGPWEMLPIFDKKTGVLMTVMRESRFKELGRDKWKRKTSHYMDALASTLNPGLLPSNGEQELFSVAESDERIEEKKKIVDNILRDLGTPLSIVRRYVVILFESRGFDLISLRACIINSDLQVVDQDDWSSYIEIGESNVVESTTVDNKAADTPNHGIQYTEKAKRRKENNISKPKTKTGQEVGCENE